MARLSENDLDQVVPGTGRTDEIGDMSRTVEVFKANAIRVRDLEAAQAAEAARAEEERIAFRDALTSEFEQTVGSVIARSTRP